MKFEDRTKRITILLTPAEDKALRRVVKEEGTTLGKYVRAALFETDDDEEEDEG